MHKIHLDPRMAKPAAAITEEPPTDADQVYVLLTDRYRISRNIRAQWYLQILNTVVTLEEKKKIEDCENEIDIISIDTPYLSEERCPSHRNFKITPTSQFKFFSRKYSFVYIIDLSTSLTNVDVHHSTVLTDEILPAITKCLKCLSEPFTVPGSKFNFEPEIYISIIVYSPFYSGDYNNVIVHGFKLCRQTYAQLLATLTLRFHDFMEELKLNIEREGTKLEGANFQNLIKSNLVSADQSLVNMIRFGMLTLSLLPENCHQGMIIVTDGDFSFPDSFILQNVLEKLRFGMISCSFIQIGSPAHPHSSFGHVPYNDFMKFFTKATFGAFISISPDYNCFPLTRHEYTVFHKAFLIWSFQYDCSSFYQELHGLDYKSSIWSIDNPYFYTTCDDYYEPSFGKRDQLLIRQRHSEAMLIASLAQILTYRLREGFTIKQVHLRPNDNRIEMILVLPWRHSVNIEYNLISTYQPESADEDEQREITYEIFFEGSYNFLHDAICCASNEHKHRIRSIYRHMTIFHFWETINSFGKNDQMSIRFHNFAKNELHRSMPESVKRGVPLFYLPPNSTNPEVQFVNEAHSRFSSHWKEICQLDFIKSQRTSMHTFQINILLRQDSQLPDYLYQTNSLGRYDNIQCNQAMSVLNVMLKDWCSFVLLENHSYIKLIGQTSNSTCSFYIVRIVSQSPCVVLNLAFIGGTSSCLRNQIINELILKLKKCKFPQRNLSSSLVQNLATENEESTIPQTPPNNDETDSSPLPYFSAVTPATTTAATATSNTTEVKNEPKSEEEPPVNQVNFKVGGDSNPATANPSPVTTVSTNSSNSSEKRTRNLSGHRYCFVLLSRSIERLLVLYERVPQDFFSCYKYEENVKSFSNSSQAPSPAIFQTLTRYLCHKRFIWYTDSPQHPNSLSVSSVSKILGVLTMKRLSEGFTVAYNDGGIVNLVMELKMRDEMGVESPCLVQYIIFPYNTSNTESISLENDGEEESSAAKSSGHFLVTECWVEPQNGLVVSSYDDEAGCEGAADFLLGLDFDQISASFYKIDKEIISCLLTYEHMVTYTNFDPLCPSCPIELYWPIRTVKKDAHYPQNPPPPPELQRFNSTPYNFELLKLLRLSQQAQVKFSMFYQIFDLPEHPAFDQPSQMSDCANMILYSEFLLKLLHNHDKEFEFSHADSSLFIDMINQRTDMSCSQRNFYFTNCHLLIADPNIRFRCYCKQISPNCLMLTLLPFSYKVVRQISFIGEGENTNERLVCEFEDNEGQRPYGALAVPIFNYKVTLTNLSHILLKTAKGNDLLMSDSWNLFYDYSLPCNKFYYEVFAKQPQAIARSDDIELENFCKRVEIFFWNSFTESVYKALQYGFEIDDRDKSLVLEKISHKTIDYIDISEFLIYTCKHLKPLVNSYFERFPGHCISDLIDYIFNREQCMAKFEPLKLKNVFSSANSCTNCHPNSESLKGAFVSYIQTYFTPIPGLASNYYFFDYENIQNVNYRQGGDERTERRKNELLKAYRMVEGDRTNLGELMDRAKRAYSKNDDSELSDGDIANIINEDEDEGIMEPVWDFDLKDTFIFSKPFFVGFSYNFSFKNGSHVLKTTSIPTCLYELFTTQSDFDLEEIELENLRVKLSIEIITQNDESPISESNRVSSASIESEFKHQDTLCLVKDTLEEFQMYKYKEFLAHIKYMISDEVVNISHDSFPVSARTLDIVVKHIRESKKSQTYSQKMDKVELKFIIEEERIDRCMGHLKEMLSGLSLPDNFKLTAMGDYFYVVHQPVAESTMSRPALIFTSSKEESFERQNCLVFNEELFEDSLQYGVSKIVSEYTVEGNHNSNLTPNFWLILTFDKTDAWMYFHSNHSIYLYGSNIFDQLRRSIEMLVKKINQIVLLERLDETRECEDLLITVEDKDPYTKANIRSALNSTPVTNLENFEPEVEITEDKNFKLVRKNFAPGSFACSVVWEKHFPLHPRLHGKDGMSAIRSVLSSFTVTNRNNLYVYKEKSGSIFYLRIYEIECTWHLFNDSSKFSYALSDSSSATLTEELASEIDSCYHYDNIIISGDCMGDSVHRGGDSDRDTDSIASFSNSPLKPIDRLTQCVLLNVHGVTEPGVFIKDDMVTALQKKLDEAVLDNLILTLTRNPLSKFTYEDVCFIQSQNSQFDNFYFVINENYMPYMANIKAYIRQNLSTFMSSPKYTDANPEFHFKLYKNDEFHCVLDEDVFILHCQQESGRDSRGVACVILSIVSKEKITTGLTSEFVLSKTDVNDFIFGNFDNITSCYSHQQENTNAPFYINFQIWSSGKIDTEDHLKKELINTIRQSLWDFNLEFNIFKLCSFEDSRSNFNSISEPSTPKKLSEKRERRSGLSIIQQTGGNFDDTKFFSSQQLWKRSDVSSPSTANVPVTKKNYFDFEMNLDKVNDLSGNLQEAKDRELYSLSRTINIAIKPWLDFGSQKQVFSLKKYSFNLVQKNSISTIIKEFNGFISNFGGDMSVDLLMSSLQNYSDLDLNSERTFEESNHLMILLRHEALWSAKYLHADQENSFTKLYHKLKNERAKLYFQPVFSSASKFWGNESNPNLSLSDSGRFTSDDQWMRCIAPRQKFLLLFIEDRNIQLYLYNWSASHVTTIVGLFSNLIIWHNSRSLLQQSLILQKAGILHHLPFKRHSFEDILKLSKVKLKDLSLPSIINIHQPSFNKETSNMGSHIFKNTDMLLKHTNPLDAFKDYQQQNKEAQSRSETIFDPKNYSFIFSSIESPSARNLFDCFNAQFNSHYNTYIKDLKDLSKIWQLHGSKLNSAIMEKITNYTKKYGRLSHFCLTPFLFSHKWRYSMAMIRDHTLPLGGGRDRARHVSGGMALTKAHSIDHEFAPSTIAAASKRSRRKSGPPNMLEHSTLAHRMNMDECLDSAVCSNYIHEYVQYLQSLGFSSVKSQKSVPLVSSVATAAAAPSTGSAKNSSSSFDQQMDRRPPPSGELRGVQKTVTFSNRKTNYSKNEIIKFYSIKTLLGGFFIFEIGFCEPYVYSYLYAFDMTRFSSWGKNDSFLTHMQSTNFLDELDSIKARMHLHSFTYDYHMRAIHSYISGRQLFFHPGYHLINFLDDFIKYYQKAPNYARNHVYSDDIRFESNRISADQLYQYISDNNKLYGLDVIEMNSSIFERLPLMASKECVLIQLSSHRIPYNDENNIRQEDNFDVGVLITSQKQPFSANSNDYNNLCLKFFLLLTSQRELFPKLSPFGDSKGIIKPIRLLPTTSASNSQSRKNSVPKAPDSMELRLPSANYPSPFSAYQRQLIAPIAAQDDQASKLGYSGICDEKINYLGYFNAHEIVMGSILTQKVVETKEHLKRIITLAEIDCRRDRLWNTLIPCVGEQRSDFPISMEELNELLLLVKSIRLDDYDMTLSEFYAFNFPWYRSLAQKLELKFEFTHRKFISKDNSAHWKMAFFKNNCKDCFILFELKNSIPFVDFKIVFKKPYETEIDYDYLQHCNPQYHELVEEFINACTSHMWSAMMT